jgi:hypothetical protein
MTDFTLTKTRMIEGIWEGILTQNKGVTALPQVQVSHLDKPVSGVQITENTDAKHWLVQIPIPVELIADGVQTFVITEARTGQTLGSFALIAGEPMAEDIRPEVDLLRAELDMLKRAFRRHCLETM